MKVRIESNFIIPGLEGNDFEIQENATVRQLLREIERLSENSIQFFRPGSETLDREEWEVDINGVPYYSYRTQLETILTDGDLVTIKIIVLGGG